MVYERLVEYMKKASTSKVITSLLWRFLERVGAEGVTLIVTILLARILDPSAFGTVAIVTSISSILGILVTGGFGNALIQKKNADELDFSSVFYFNIVLGLGLYLIMFFLAPHIASFYKINELTALIRVSSISIIVASVKNILQAYVSRNMLFKRFFFATLGGTIGAAILGIYLAYAGFGAWALVAQSLFNHTVDTIILWFTVKWRPNKCFSFGRLKPLISYGWKLLLSTMLGTAYSRINQLIIGKVYSADDLAYFNKGENFPSLIASNVTDTINSVLFPTLSENQDDKTRLYEITKRFVRISTFIMMPFMAGLAVCAEGVIGLVLSAKWLPSVPFLRLFCISYALWPINAANLNATKAIGRSEIYLRMVIVSSIIKLSMMALLLRFGVIYVAVGHTVASVIESVIYTIPNKKAFGYGCWEQFKDILPNVVLSLIMALGVYGVGRINLPIIVSLIIQVMLGAIIYLIGSIVSKNDSFAYCVTVIKTFTKGRATEKKSTDV